MQETVKELQQEVKILKITPTTLLVIPEPKEILRLDPDPDPASIPSAMLLIYTKTSSAMIQTH